MSSTSRVSVLISLLFSAGIIACAPSQKNSRSFEPQPDSESVIRANGNEPAVQRAGREEVATAARTIERVGTSETSKGRQASNSQSHVKQAELQTEASFQSKPLKLPRELPELEAFYSALDGLRSGERGVPVRILWLGDSHIAADFMTNEIRRHFSQVAGAGGPGFVRLGLQGYRHGEFRISSFGTIRKAPILPAQRTRVLDGVFGYGGLRTRPQSTSGVSVELKKRSDTELRWTLSYRLLKGARLQVELGDRREILEANPEQAATGGIESFSILGRADERFSLRHLSGKPEVFGAFCEYKEPGVVLDTNGINGARTATPLAWEAKQFIEQVSLRDPELLVLAYGTNEIFDRTAVSRYRKHTTDVVARARRAKPEMPCWVIGPPDAAKKQGGSLSRVTLVTKAQRDAAEEMGCAFTSLFELMGGEGSFSRWMGLRPSLARSDRVHFTVSGYRKLGQLLAEKLVSSAHFQQVAGGQTSEKTGATDTQTQSATERAQ